MPAPRDEPRIARIAAQIAEPARARMLTYLMGGDHASAGELAAAASVSPSTASGHLARLCDDGLLVAETRGRHRYSRLADADVVRVLEALALVAERGRHERGWASPARRRLRCARTCYGHLAGQLGVALFSAMREHRWLTSDTDGFVLTAAGEDWLAGIGIDPASLGGRSGRGGRPCLDWSERRDHLAGPLATRLLAHFVERGWLRRRTGERALEITPPGRQSFGRWLSEVPADPPPGAPPDAPPDVPPGAAAARRAAA